MLTIRRNDTILRVTSGAFLGMYKGLGFTVVAGEGFKPSLASDKPNNTYTPDNLENADEDDSDSSEDDFEANDLSEIPVSEMTFKQLKAYADQLGVVYGNGTPKKELRALIRRAVDM